MFKPAPHHPRRSRSPSAPPPSPSLRWRPPRAAPASRVSGVCTQELDRQAQARAARTAASRSSSRSTRIATAFPWKVTLRRNGSLVASATATTRAPSGSFSAAPRDLGRARQRSSPSRRAPPASAARLRPQSEASTPSPRTGGRRQPTVRLAPADRLAKRKRKVLSREPRQSRVTTLSGARRYLEAA